MKSRINEFLKPDKRKAIIFNLIILITYLGVFLESYSYCCPRYNYYWQLVGIIGEKLWAAFILIAYPYFIAIAPFFIIENLFTSGYFSLTKKIIFYSGVIPYAYLLSCLITWVHGKLVKREK